MSDERTPSAPLTLVKSQAQLALEVECGRLRGKVNELYRLQRENAELKEKLQQHEARRRQLEQIVQSSFSRAVRGLSGDNATARTAADKVVAIVEDHFQAKVELDRAVVPGNSVAAGVRFLLRNYFPRGDFPPSPTSRPVEASTHEPTTFFAPEPLFPKEPK